MPISGDTPILPSEPRFFGSLSDLDSWAESPSKPIEGIIPFIPRNTSNAAAAQNSTRGKLLVCHDYKGGYIESPFSLAYTFNFWDSCDTFVYFAHQRVTVPPPGWVNAAHRQGVKMLGVLIFENMEAQDDLLNLFFGKLPPSMLNKSGAQIKAAPPTIPVSPYYARVLAELAHQRGFDGYLMNFEWPLPGATSQARVLAAWVSLLREELWKRVGPHAEVVWYDSVTALGELSWQDRLNAYNLPYFLSSTGFFTNYTWPTSFPETMAQYFDSLNSTLLSASSAPNGTVISQTLSREDVFVGVDVWGRGTFGGGGFGTYRALEFVAPDSLGLSAALFAPGWTWETSENDVGRTWEQWWNEEISLWAGIMPGFDVPARVPEYRYRRREQPHTMDDTYKPILDFFVTKSPPDPKDLPFFTTFSPGVGRAWWVDGEKVWNGVMGDTWTTGWEDVEKQCSVGNLAWPSPKLAWAFGGGSDGGILPITTVALSLDDAWNGGSSLQLSFSDPADDSTSSRSASSSTRSIFVPIQSLSLTSGVSYIATAVYKIQTLADGITVSAALTANLLIPESTTNDYAVQVSSKDFDNSGWMGVGAQLTVVPQTSANTEGDASLTSIDVALGLVLSITDSLPGSSPRLELLTMLLGQMNVFTIPFSDDGLTWESTILWADFQPNAASSAEALSRDSGISIRSNSIGDVNGILTWQVETSLLPLNPESHPIISADDPIPIFGQVTPDGSWVERFNYFNIYVQPITPPVQVRTPSLASDDKPADTVWIGTSGVDYGGDSGWFTGRFEIIGRNISLQMPNVTGVSGVRFFVQGFNEHGDVTEWSQCAFVDVQLTPQFNNLTS